MGLHTLGNCGGRRVQGEQYLGSTGKVRVHHRSPLPVLAWHVLWILIGFGALFLYDRAVHGGGKDA